MKNVNILFVDDEPKIVLTMPHILRQQGYQVTAADNVAEALTHITSTQFDVLISDLNIGEQDDGLVVVSAMRRTQPDCLILILTGYPGFDTALEAMRNQVDEYLVKPAPVATLLDLIEQKLLERKRDKGAATKRIHQVLRENVFEITQRALRAMRSDIRLGALDLSDEQRIENVPRVLDDLAAMLEATESQEIEKIILRDAELQGARQYRQGYSIPLMAAYIRHLERAMLDVIHDQLPSLMPSHFMFDLKRLDASLALQLEHSLKAYLDAQSQNGLLSAQQR